MSREHEDATRKIHMHLVRNGDVGVIHFTNPDWLEATVTLTCKNGLVSIVFHDPSATSTELGSFDLTLP